MPALIAALFRSLAVLARVLLDRVADRGGVRGDGFPRSAADVDAAWLTTAMRSGGAGVRVVRVERLGGHAGTTARERIALETEPAGTLPGSLFLKLTPPGLVTQAFNALFDLGATEVGIYRCLGGELPVKTPRAFYARAAPRGGRFVLLLEDLAEPARRFVSSESPVTLLEACAVVTALARLHAAYWESPRFEGDLAWLRRAGGGPNRAFEWWLAARANGPALERFGAVVSAEVRAGTTRIAEHRAALERHWASAPQTLLHGDPHSGNLYFEGEEAGFFDWQVAQVGPGLRDVSYFLVNSVETELRRSHERELIELYLSVLRAGGVTPPAFDEVWQEHRLFALYTWIAISVTAATPGLQPAPIVRRACARTGAALDDLASFDALDELLRRVPRAGAPPL